ncbi:MAG: class I SAM-dependent methyltransferase [Nitrososphaera sp.]|nr:class I SAM-dependent methyltransferase [Nitrososphaera sp.]
MGNRRDSTREDAIKANIYVHAFLASSGEYQKSPHFMPENREKVRHTLRRLATSLTRGRKTRLIDFGCGTGFVIDLVKDLFDEVHGIDITVEMMRRVDSSSGNVYLCRARAEQTPFAGGVFDFATAYSFMDHLFDYKEFLEDVYRVLKPGGIFYSDLNPNRAFIVAMKGAEGKTRDDLNPIVEREIMGALHNGELYAQQFGIMGRLLEAAEPGKSIDGGFDAQEVLNTARRIGFSRSSVKYEWFLGQGKVIHEKSPEAAETIDRHLQACLPVSSQFFKYLQFVFVK